MPVGVLTLEPGSRFWFEGEAWEVDAFLGDQAHLRRGSTVRSVSVSALLASATPLDEPPPEDRSQVFELPAVALAGLTARQRRELDRKVEELRPMLAPVTGGPSRTKQVAAHAVRSVCRCARWNDGSRGTNRWDPRA